MGQPRAIEELSSARDAPRWDLAALRVEAVAEARRRGAPPWVADDVGSRVAEKLLRREPSAVRSPVAYAKAAAARELIAMAREDEAHARRVERVQGDPERAARPGVRRDPPTNVADPAAEAHEEAEFRSALVGLLNDDRLRPVEAEALMLTYSGLASRDIAEILGITRQGVDDLLRRARSRAGRHLSSLSKVGRDE
jgi:DNA-directed RNA polymerase specialized sigma24 family protein